MLMGLASNSNGDRLYCKPEYRACMEWEKLTIANAHPSPNHLLQRQEIWPLHPVKSRERNGKRKSHHNCTLFLELSDQDHKPLGTLLQRDTALCFCNCWSGSLTHTPFSWSVQHGSKQGGSGHQGMECLKTLILWLCHIPWRSKDSPSPSCT